MRRLVYLTAARNDLADILEYITERSGSLATAKNFVATLRAQCHKLAALPGTVGRSRPELRQDIRGFPYRGYMIFFRYAGDDFEVVDILEGHRDVEGYFEWHTWRGFYATNEAAPPVCRRFRTHATPAAWPLLGGGDVS